MGWQSFFPKVLLCEFLLSLLLKLRMRHVTLGWERANPAFPRRLSSRLSLGGQARHPPLPTRICTLSAQLPRLAPRLRHWHRAYPASVPTAPSAGVATRPPPTRSRGAPGTGHAFACSADFASAGPGLGVGVAGTRASYLLPACFLLPVTLQGSSWGPVRTRCSDSGADYLVGGWAWTAESAAEIILTLLLSGSG